MTRGRLLYGTFLALAVCVGLFFAWIDSRPGWDDAGVMAGILLASSMICGCAAPRRPWLWALAIGAWIPLFSIVRWHDAGALLAPAISAVGAYGGAGVRKLLDGASA
jgi:hypothetical protein